MDYLFLNMDIIFLKIIQYMVLKKQLKKPQSNQKSTIKIDKL